MLQVGVFFGGKNDYTRMILAAKSLDLVHFKLEWGNGSGAKTNFFYKLRQVVFFKIANKFQSEMKKISIHPIYFVQF